MVCISFWSSSMMIPLEKKKNIESILTNEGSHQIFHKSCKIQLTSC